MKKPKAKTIVVNVERLVPGLFVDLNMSWRDHPFLFSRFKIKSKQEIAIIKELGISEVTVYPDRSDAKASTPDAKTEQQYRQVTKSSLWESKQARIDKATPLLAVNSVKNLTNCAPKSPKSF